MKRLKDDPLLFKIAALALNPAAPDGEWNAAACKFFLRLRNAEVTVENLFGKEAPKKESEPKHRPFFGMMPFGKYKGKSIEWIFQQDIGYVEWLMSIDCDPRIREEIIRIGKKFGEDF